MAIKPKYQSHAARCGTLVPTIVPGLQPEGQSLARANAVTRAIFPSTNAVHHRPPASRPSRPSRPQLQLYPSNRPGSAFTTIPQHLLGNFIRFRRRRSGYKQSSAIHAAIAVAVTVAFPTTNSPGTSRDKSQPHCRGDERWQRR